MIDIVRAEIAAALTFFVFLLLLLLLLKMTLLFLVEVFFVELFAVVACAVEEAAFFIEVFTAVFVAAEAVPTLSVRIISGMTRNRVRFLGVSIGTIVTKSNDIKKRSENFISH